MSPAWKIMTFLEGLNNFQLLTHPKVPIFQAGDIQRQLRKIEERRRGGVSILSGDILKQILQY